MNIPRWMLTLLSLGAAAIGALVTAVSVSYSAGSKLTELTVQLSHVGGMLAPALASVASHETRLTVAEVQIRQCCPGVVPKVSLGWLEPGPVGSELTGVRAGAEPATIGREAVAGTLPGAVASRGVW